MRIAFNRDNSPLCGEYYLVSIARYDRQLQSEPAVNREGVTMNIHCHATFQFSVTSHLIDNIAFRRACDDRLYGEHFLIRSINSRFNRA